MIVLKLGAKLFRIIKIKVDTRFLQTDITKNTFQDALMGLKFSYKKILNLKMV